MCASFYNSYLVGMKRITNAAEDDRGPRSRPHPPATGRKENLSPASPLPAPAMALWVAALPIALPAQARPPLERSAVRLTTGLEMEWLRQPAAAGAPAGSADVLFVHGSLHGAWCWAEHWMGYLSDRGFTSHAISLRGSSGSPDGARRVRAAQHVADLGAFVEGPLAGSRPGSPPPTIVAHSFGGAYLYEYLARGRPASAAAFLCPVPPSGNMAMVGRSLRRSPRTAILVTRGLAFKSVTRSAADARQVFFDDALPEDRVQRCARHSRPHPPPTFTPCKRHVFLPRPTFVFFGTLIPRLSLLRAGHLTQVRRALRRRFTQLARSRRLLAQSAVARLRR